MKKITSLFVLALLLVLTACGSDETKKADDLNDPETNQSLNSDDLNDPEANQSSNNEEDNESEELDLGELDLDDFGLGDFDLDDLDLDDFGLGDLDLDDLDLDDLDLGEFDLEDLDLDELDIDNLNEKVWENINLSKKQFDQLLEDIVEADDNGEVVFNKVEMTNDKEIVLTFNNSDEESSENSFSSVFIDGFIRQSYKNSDYYKSEEPIIKFVDLSGFVVAENDGPIDFDFGE